MGKALKSWSGMRKYLEKEMLAESLQGRIRYNCATYAGMEGEKIFEIFVDGCLAKQFSLETVNSYFRNSDKFKNGNKDNSPVSMDEYWKDFWNTLDETPLNMRDEYTDDEFCDALKIYRNQNIFDSINSQNPIIRMFAVLDKRIGKRTLENLNETLNANPVWLIEFYKLRLDAEEI